MQLLNLANGYPGFLQDVNRITDEVIQQHSLSRLSPNSLVATSTQAAVPSNTDGVAELPFKIQQLDLASQQSPHSATAPPPALHTPQASSTIPDETTEEPAQVADAVLRHQLPASRKAVSSQEQQHQSESAPAELDSNAAGAEGASAAHKPAAKQCIEKESKQLPVPCVSIAGWEESPVSVGCQTRC